MRLPLISKLIFRWNKDFKAILATLNPTDQIQFTESLIKFTELHKKVKEDYPPIAELYDNDLVKKFGSKLRLASELNFWIYFDQLQVMVDKDIITTEEFNNAEIQGMSDQEFDYYLNNLIRSLQITREYLYLSQEPGNDKQDEIEASSANVEFTTARQVLAIDFLFRYLKIDVSNPPKARFIKFLTGKSYDNVLKWVKDPEQKTEKQRKADLEFIKEYFKDLKHTEILILIDKEINKIKKV